MQAANYQLEPAIDVRGVELSADGRVATVMLSAPPAPDKPYTLRVRSVADASPAKNAMGETSATVTARGPVYRLDVLGKEHEGATIRGVKNLPTGASAPWTINMFVRTDKQPANRTVIAGFGRCDDKVGATGRYLSKFGSGIHFWSRNADVEGNTALDLNQWQMLTATSDGSTIRLYKNAKMIAEQAAALADDEPIITLLPLDPWENKRRFAGEVRGFTVWDSALTPDSLGVLHGAFKAP
jgi:alpha-mannosidase